MRKLPSQPVIYEIDTWVWLDDLSRTLGRRVALDAVPDNVWDAALPPGIDAVWLMGVWERSPAAVRVARETPSFVSSFVDAVPDYQPDDVVGSPYSVHQYVVDEALGGPQALVKAREQLAQRNLGLVLDYVPNHVAIDNPWTTAHPEYFIEAAADTDFDPANFVIVEDRPLALGRDPYFPPWPDVVQLNAFSQGVRDAAAQTIQSISDQCDGVRCDMGMLFINDVFEKTWGHLVGGQPEAEFWPGVIGAVRAHQPGFTFIAEAYWDMESNLLEQGFDYCYDKRLYDRLTHEDAGSVNAHLQAGLSYQQHVLRFLENHDEQRAAASMNRDRERAAAIAVAFLPGAKLYHEGQLEGRQIHNPVPLGRRRVEPADKNLHDFYTRLMDVAGHMKPGEDWRLCQTDGWPDNHSHENFLAWTWSADGPRHLVVVNFADGASQGVVRLPWTDLQGKMWGLVDELSGTEFKRDGNELASDGLYVELPPWGGYVLTAGS